jgi:hypothetical protein
MAAHKVFSGLEPRMSEGVVAAAAGTFQDERRAMTGDTDPQVEMFYWLKDAIAVVIFLWVFVAYHRRAHQLIHRLRHWIEN